MQGVDEGITTITAELPEDQSPLEDHDDNSYADNNYSSDTDSDTIEPPVSHHHNTPSMALPSTVKPWPTGRRKQTVTKCRLVPVVYSGSTIVKLGEICSQVPASVDMSSTGS